MMGKGSHSGLVAATMMTIYHDTALPADND